MRMPPAPPVFVDTSVLIAQLVHAPETKERIRARLRQHGEVVTGLVVRQEMKRRLLKEVQYLLGVLEEEKTVQKVRRRLERLPRQQARKERICNQLIMTVDEQDSEEDLADRLRLYLKGLLRDGLDDLEQMVTRMTSASGCGCARQEVKLKKGRYDFGTDQCSRLTTPCGIVAFLAEHKAPAQVILAALESLPESQKTAELQRAQRFLQAVVRDGVAAAKEDPCLTVGDLLIALESVGVPHFYTLNRAESTHLCAALGQTLIVRPQNPAHPDDVIPPPQPQQQPQAQPNTSAGSPPALGQK